MNEQNEFCLLMDRIRAGDSAAARELTDRFGSHLLLIVRRFLGRDLRSRFESVDFTQTIWKSFFANREELAGVNTPEALAAYLATMARNKVVRQVRRHVNAAKRQVSREERFDHAKGEATPGREPTPSKVVIAQEVWERLHDGASPEVRQILELRLAGLTMVEVAEQIGVSERTVRRILDRMKAE